jgi:hypothetical protein
MIFFQVRELSKIQPNPRKTAEDFLYIKRSKVILFLRGYFAITSFFLGACVASLPNQKQIISAIPNIPKSWDEAA